MIRADQIQISRKNFVTLGASVLLLSSATALSPFAAKAQTVNFSAASTARLSQFCRGDGSDETAKIQNVFDNYLFVEVDEPPAGIAYGIGQAGGARIRSGLEIDGTGFGKFVRAGNFKRGQACLINSDRNNGNRGIKLHNIKIDGRRNTDPSVPKVDSDNDTTCIAFKVRDGAGEKLSNISFTNVEVRDWPGIGISVVNGKHFNYTDVKNINSARGGIRFTAACYDINLLRCISENTGDTSFGFWATSFVFGGNNSDLTAGDLHDISLTNCRSNTRTNSQYGAALNLYGARSVTARGCTFGPAKNDVVHIHSDTWTSRKYIPKDILIQNCNMLGGKSNSVQILSDNAERVRILDNRISRPLRNCVSIQPVTKGRHRLDVTVANNVLEKPGWDHINIHTNISGVKTTGNRLIYSDAAKPKITSPEPAPNSKTKDRTPTVRVKIRDASEVRKNDIKLFINGKRVPSRKLIYYPSAKLVVYRTPTLRYGKNRVRVTATDIARNTGSRSWSFRIVK